MCLGSFKNSDTWSCTVIAFRTLCGIAGALRTKETRTTLTPGRIAWTQAVVVCVVIVVCWLFRPRCMNTEITWKRKSQTDEAKIGNKMTIIYTHWQYVKC